jgi:exonuclease III
MRFLFWNVGVGSVGTASNPLGFAKQGLIEQICRLVGDLNPDVLTLIEFGNPFPTQQSLRKKMHARTGTRYYFHYSDVPGIAHFTRRFVRLQSIMTPNHGSSKRYEMRHLKGLQRDVLLVSVHAPSKLKRDEQDQQLFFGQLARHADEVATNMSLPKVILGDMNADPYEPAIVGVQHLHASMTTSEPKKRRTVFAQGNVPLFNPMWSLFAERLAGAPGTYYFNQGKSCQAYWHIFDQVLIDRSLMVPIKRLGSVGIVSKIKPNENLAGLLRKKQKPDHLPVYFDLNI